MSGEDLDAEGAALPITLTWSSIDIAGVENLVFSGQFSYFQGSERFDAVDAITVGWQVC